MKEKAPAAVFLWATLALYGCGQPRALVEPSIEFTRLPPAGEGNPDRILDIEGVVKGAGPGQRVVLFARAGVWWVQPTTEQPFTEINPDSTWASVTHPGSGYAALLVTESYRPPATAKELPPKGGAILAIAKVEGSILEHPELRTISFAGYEWRLREAGSNRGGTNNAFDPDNVWTDQDGFLHLRVAKNGDDWTSAEAGLASSLGYGQYRFVVRDIAHLEPAAVFSLFTWDDAGPPREVNIEISRWGELGAKNAQYIIQPYYVPANVIRFEAPAGRLTHSIEWDPGRISFKTVRGAGAGAKSDVVAEHVFSSGVPEPGNEKVHINLYVYGNKSNPLQRGSEVVIEQFEYLP